MSDTENPKRALSPRSPKFQPAVHQIPTPGSEHARPPRYEPFVLNFWLIRVVSFLMICSAIVLQIVFHLSRTRNGFPVPSKNIFHFGSTQFLTSFFPTLLAVPLALFWTSTDWLLRWYQPYVTLSQEKTPASRSILLDYVALNQLSILYNSLVNKHLLIGISTLIALSVLLFQPLAGSLLQMRQVSHTTDTNAFLMQTLGLSSTINTLDGYLGAVGFIIAAAFSNLLDPPFVHGVWAAGKFQPPSSMSYLNGTLAVKTTAIQTEVNCASSASLSMTNSSGNYVASATFPNGCSVNNTFDPSIEVQQFNTTIATNCASQGSGIEVQPVVFWWANLQNAEVASVFCNPTMKVYQVQTSMNLTTGALGPCTIITPAEGTNNVTGSPLNGRPYNGVIFNSSNDSYTSSRAQAIQFIIPDAISRYVSQQPGGLSSAFQNQSKFLAATELVYTQYLSIAAQNNYFLGGNSTIPATLTTYVPRLFVEPIPAMILTPLLIVIGITGFWVHFLHRRARSRLWLTSPPGSIASIVALTSRSGFGEFLLPYDDERRMEDNLAHLRFYMDPRTGAIAAEEDRGPVETSDGVALLGHLERY